MDKQNAGGAREEVKKREKEEEKEGNGEGLGHLAALAGLGLISHLAEYSEIASEGIISESPGGRAVAVDPRDAVEPRKRFVPR